VGWTVNWRRGGWSWSPVQCSGERYNIGTLLTDVFNDVPSLTATSDCASMPPTNPPGRCSIRALYAFRRSQGGSRAIKARQSTAEVSSMCLSVITTGMKLSNYDSLSLSLARSLLPRAAAILAVWILLVRILVVSILLVWHPHLLPAALFCFSAAHCCSLGLLATPCGSLESG
jgi:hypothetical protein